MPLDEGVPDHSTIWRFRQTFAALGAAEKLFLEINRQLDARGLIIRKGTLIDATIVKPAVAPPPAKEGTVSERDPEAGWTTKNGESTFGYKAHIAVDEGSNLIREAILTGADLHDSQAVRALIQGDETAVYADKAYASKDLRDHVQSCPQQTAEDLANLVQQVGRAYPCRGRARLRHHEAALRFPPGPLYRPYPERLRPSAHVYRHQSAPCAGAGRVTGGIRLDQRKLGKQSMK